MAAPQMLVAGAANDDANQHFSGSSYASAGNTAGLHVVAASTGSAASRNVVGIRFEGTIPVGTVQVPRAVISIAQTGSATQASVPFHVYGVLPTNVISGTSYTATPTSPSANQLASMGLGAPVLLAGTTAGTGDVISRTKTTASLAFTSPSTTGHYSIDIDLGQDIFRELMQAAGATGFGAGYIATSGTTVAITNPMFIFQGDVLGSGTTLEFNMYSYDQYLADTTNLLSLARLPVLAITALDASTTTAGVQHFAYCLDSFGWMMGPGKTLPSVRVSFFNSFVTGTQGTLNKTGFIDVKDGSTDTAPGGVPLGYATLQDETGQWYQINDPQGTIYGQGSWRQEARSGYTPNGIFADRLTGRYGVSASNYIAHHYGYGGTTIARRNSGTGVWCDATNISDTSKVSLDSITTLAGLSGVTNFLFNYKDSTDGHTLLTLLTDPSVKHLCIFTPTCGNDAFLAAQNGGTLPISGDSGHFATCESDITAGLLTFIRFCKRAWGFVSHGSGSTIEFIIPGLPNVLTDDPRVPAVNVNVGAPTSSPTYHRGSFPLPSNPDAWYGGPNPSGPTDKMAPYGNSPSTVAATGTTGTVNVIPQPPHIVFYSLAGLSFLGFSVPAPTTNIAGGLPVPWAGLRAACKDDLGVFHQVRISWVQSTWNRDYQAADYLNWYSHWFADHYGNSFSNARLPSESDPNHLQKNQWDNALLAGQGPYNTFPYGAAGFVSGGIELPWNNIPIAVSYCGRNITNQTVNEMLQTVIPAGANSAVTTLTGESTQVVYVPLWDSLGGAVGSGVTASADRKAFLDGTHLTQAASKTWNDALIAKARSLGSPALLTLIPASAVTTTHVDKVDSLGNTLVADNTTWASGDLWRCRWTITAAGPLASASVAITTLTAPALDGAGALSAKFHAYDMPSLTDIVAPVAVNQGDTKSLGSLADGSITRVELTGVCAG